MKIHLYNHQLFRIIWILWFVASWPKETGSIIQRRPHFSCSTPHVWLCGFFMDWMKDNEGIPPCQPPTVPCFGPLGNHECGALPQDTSQPEGSREASWYPNLSRLRKLCPKLGYTTRPSFIIYSSSSLNCYSENMATYIHIYIYRERERDRKSLSQSIQISILFREILKRRASSTKRPNSLASSARCLAVSEAEELLIINCFYGWKIWASTGSPKLMLSNHPFLRECRIIPERKWQVILKHLLGCQRTMREIHKTRIQAYKYMDMPPNNETWQWEINFELAFILYIMEKPHTHIYIYIINT